ncbi:MAG: hemolysin family protein [Propionibacteriaceae bacterium]|nr:hemolysin family protein [Propionibacteriaceae bacterium]
MNTLDWIWLGAALACVVLAAVGLSVESAFQSMSKAHAKELVEAGRGGAERLAAMVQDPSRYLNSSHLLRSLLEIAAVVFVALAFFDTMVFDWERILFPALIMTVVSFVLLGVVPATVGRQHSESIALRASGPLKFITSIVGPFARLLILFGNAITPGKGFTEGPFSSEAELRELVDMAEERDLIEADERKMIHSVFELGDTIVREIMVPRTEMVSIERGKTLRQGISLALRSGFSRIPVLGEDTDDVIGVFYIKDAMKRAFDYPAGERTETVESIMRKASFCPDSKPVDDLLKDMQRTHSQMVIVIDEFGGTSGLATIEDALEEIVGEIQDEYDQEVAPVVDLGDGRYRVSARLTVDDLGELFGMDLDDDDVDTVLGLLSKQIGKVPIPGASTDWNGIRLTAERSSGRRHAISTLIAERVPEEEPAEDEEAAS